MKNREKEGGGKFIYTGKRKAFSITNWVKRRTFVNSMIIV